MMAVVNANSGKVVTTLAIGPGVDGTDFRRRDRRCVQCVRQGWHAVL